MWNGTTSGNKRKSSSCGFGFLTALEFQAAQQGELTADTSSKQHPPVEEKGTPHHHPPSNRDNLDDFIVPNNQTSFTVDLTIRGLQFYTENVQSSIANDSIITLQRQPDNEHDGNAIAAFNGTQQIIGHVAKEQAAILASLMDENIIEVKNVLVKEQRDTSLSITVEIALLNDDKRAEFQRLYQRISTVTYKTKTKKQVDPRSIIDDAAVEQYAKGITAQDSETAATCTIDICEQPNLPWRKNQDGSTASWPPSPEVLEKMGVGSADDAHWWQVTAGLKPPSQWKVEGAIDLLPSISMSSHQKTCACRVLDDAVHGVTNVWSDETLEDIRDLMHSENFWSHRGSDAFIRSFGGPYVLGQNEGKLKLIKGSSHVQLTEKICRGHNLVYEMIHGEKPPGSGGFNTLIFGLNLRRSGFHYHQDTIASLKPKNEPMVAHQPVVTTVYYQKPHIDNGKELVLWRPLLNFKPKGESLYLAARGIRTTHGMIHVQRAGLQGHAQHGIFHTPIFSEDGEEGEAIASSDPRQGYRVAITARITYPDSEKRLDSFIKNSHYQRIIGPNGLSSLHLS